MEMIEKHISIPVENFWKAVQIYHDRPKSINKQVLEAERICVFKLGRQLSEDQILSFHNEMKNSATINEESSEKILKNHGFTTEDFILTKEEIFDETSLYLSEYIYLSARRLIPKSPNHSACLFYEICYIDLPSSKIDFLTCCFENPAEESKELMELNPLTILKYRRLSVCHAESNLTLKFDEDMTEKGLNWLKLFLEKFEKFMFSNLVTECRSNLKFKNAVPILNYYCLYEMMKSKYGKFLVDNWTENTDPKKFVYEDIGIATYLLLLWNGGTIPGEDSKKIKFVDLGCGNGLLVYILNSEGHGGVGLDLRKRKIWDSYPASTKLKVETINPASSTIYPEADWLIGNHSDELTAWIPIMANRSNPTCQYFVLPCCPYKLNGQKYQRQNSGMSAYQDFMFYVKKISKMCGFETVFDKLKIPSTKRICLVGFRKWTCDGDKISDFISSECLSFQARDSVEPVRNCTRLPRKIVADILTAVMKKLSESENFISVECGGKVKKWNLGSELTISDLAEALTSEQLKILKQECKGLQTLLKNNHYIFEVYKGRVRLRHPDSMMENSNNVLAKGLKWKSKICWYFNYHPDGCPLDDKICSYKHGN